MESLANMKLNKMIGHGSFSCVYEGRIGDTLYAVKMVSLERTDKSVVWDSCALISNETQRMRELNHPNILKLVGTFNGDNGMLGLVMPLMSYGSCSQLLQAYFPTGLPEVAVGLIMKDILSALVYLHERHYIHNGVKPSHILISREGNAVLSGTRFMIKNEKGHEKVLLIHNLNEMTENLNWLSPEILSQNRDGFTSKADVYSLGLSCITLATGTLPFDETAPSAMLIKKLNEAPPSLWRPNDKEVAANALADDSSLEEPRVAKEYSKELQNFVSLCSLKEYLRPTSSEMLREKFIKSSSHSGITILKILEPHNVKCLESRSPMKGGAENFSKPTTHCSSSDFSWNFTE